MTIDQAIDRSTFIGGSEIAAIMGLSRWETPLSIWAQKTGKITKDLSDNEAVEMGIALEGFVADLFAKRTGKEVKVDDTHFTHPDYEFMAAHIDRRVVPNEILEVKTCSAYKAHEWDGEEVPEEYHLQLNYYLGIVGDKVGHLAVLIGGQKFVYKQIDFSQELFDRQVEVAKMFWEEYVGPDVAPMAISTDKDTLIELYPESRPDELRKIEEPDLESQVNQLAIDRLEGKNQIKEIIGEVDLAENTLRQLIGDDEGIETGQYKITWKTQNKTSVDTQAMKDDGIYDKYKRVGTTRVLRVAEKKSQK